MVFYCAAKETENIEEDTIDSVDAVGTEGHDNVQRFKYITTGVSHLSWIIWEHENLSGLSVSWLIYIKFYKEKEKNLVKILG